jgi:hypothetical protein
VGHPHLQKAIDHIRVGRGDDCLAHFSDDKQHQALFGRLQPAMQQITGTIALLYQGVIASQGNPRFARAFKHNQQQQAILHNTLQHADARRHEYTKCGSHNSIQQALSNNSLEPACCTPPGMFFTHSKEVTAYLSVPAPRVISGPTCPCQTNTPAMVFTVKCMIETAHRCRFATHCPMFFPGTKFFNEPTHTVQCCMQHEHQCYAPAMSASPLHLTSYHYSKCPACLLWWLVPVST